MAPPFLAARGAPPPLARLDSLRSLAAAAGARGGESYCKAAEKGTGCGGRGERPIHRDATDDLVFQPRQRAGRYRGTSSGRVRRLRARRRLSGRLRGGEALLTEPRKLVRRTLNLQRRLIRQRWVPSGPGMRRTAVARPTPAAGTPAAPRRLWSRLQKRVSAQFAATFG